MASTTKIRRNNHPDGGLVVFLLMALVMLKEKGVMGQQVPDCASKLVPCGNYLNSTTPPDSCCSPLREAVRTELKCLCNLYSDRQIFKSLGINITQALELPKHCGVTSNLTACKEQGTHQFHTFSHLLASHSIGTVTCFNKSFLLLLQPLHLQPAVHLHLHLQVRFETFHLSGSSDCWIITHQ